MSEKPKTDKKDKYAGVRKSIGLGMPNPEHENGEVKVIELGQVAEGDSLLEEISGQLDSLDEKTDTSPDKEAKAEPAEAPREKARDAKTEPAEASMEKAGEAKTELADAPGKSATETGKPAVRKKAPSKTAAEPKTALKQKGKAAASGGSPSGRAPKPVSAGRKTVGPKEKKPGAASQRHKLEEARMRSATAARKAKQKKTGKGVLLFLAVAILVIGLSAAGGFYFFRPDSAPVPEKPVKFAVKNSPGIKIEAPREPSSAAAAPETETPPAPETRAVKPSPASAPSTAESSAAAQTATSSDAPPETPSPAASKQSIREFLFSWKSAWEGSAGDRGRIGPFISHFSKNFQSEGMDLAAWKEDKAAKNRRKEWIRIRIDNIRVSNPAPDGTVKVRFVQSYASSNYSDTTEKTLILSLEQGQWKILGFGD